MKKKQEKEKKERYVFYLNSKTKHKLQVLSAISKISMSSTIEKLLKSYIEAIRNNQGYLDYQIPIETVKKINSEVKV